MNNRRVRKPSKTEPRLFYGYIVVITSLSSMVAMWGIYQAFGIFFKPLLTEFGWTRAMTAGAFSLSMVLQGSMGIVMGRLNDRFGPRVVMTICGFLLGLGYWLMSQVSTIWQMYLFYGVIIGIGMGGSWVPLTSTVARWFVARRSMMTGVVLTGVGIGGLIGPPLANWLISIYDWRISYIMMGSLVLVVVVLCAQFLKRDPAKVGQSPYSESKEKEQGLKSETEGLSLGEAFQTRQFWQAFTMFFGLGFGVFTIIVHIVPHAIDLGISGGNAANILATISGLGILGMIFLGNIADRIGNRKVFILGLFLMALTLFWLLSAVNMWMLYLFAVVFGFVNAGCGASESPLVAKLFGMKSHGLIYGAVTFGFAIGGAIGPVITGYIFDIMQSYKAAFLVAAALFVISLILAILLKPLRGREIRL
ncbi:MFS transporter [Chloroflexota bacterium]